MMKKYLSLLLSLALLAALLTGCGSAGKSAASYDSGMVEYAVSDEAAMAPAEGAAMKNTAADTGSTQLPQNRKWIVTVNLTAETDDLDALRSALDEKIAALNGYVEDQSVYNGSIYDSGRRYRSANLTVRIPADSIDAFLQDVGGLANIVRQNKSIEDVTLSYVATESRLKALETEEARLLELLSQAENMTDLLEIEARLSEVRSELENYASQKRLYDNQIDYATIYIAIEEVQEYTPTEEPSLWERIRDGFKDNLEGVGEGLLDVLVWFIVSIPTLVVLAVVVLILVLIVRRIRRRRKAKKAAKQQKTEE
ncbi:MAG: DUF4349 domain-containing protein [Clostridiales bacterium]|nr:DUF4349 domain-containing protein [Clostridiales bacterium]